MDGESPLRILAHRGAPSIPRGLSAGAAGHAAPLLLKLEEAGPPHAVPSLPAEGDYPPPPACGGHQPAHTSRAVQDYQSPTLSSATLCWWEHGGNPTSCWRSPGKAWGSPKGAGGAVTAPLGRRRTLPAKGTGLHTSLNWGLCVKTSIWKAGQILPDRDTCVAERIECLHSHTQTHRHRAGVSRRDLTEGRSLPASEMAPEPRDALCRQPGFRHQSRLTVNSKPFKLCRSQTTEVTHESCTDGQRRPYKPNSNLRATHLSREHTLALSRNSHSTGRPRKAGRFSTFRHSLAFLSYS